MKFSLEWLRDHLAAEASAGDIAERLTAAGHAVDALEEVEGDTVYDLDICTNRPDCMSARGLARDLGAVYGTAPRGISSLLEVPESGGNVTDEIDVEIGVPDLCHRFMVRAVTGIRVGPSPEWMAARLRRVGLRPVNNLVDITNYVMLELGHPMHAFDLATLRGRRLHIRRAAAGERLVTLDGTARTLQDWMIVIADGERPVSLAGIMGGNDTEISDSTTDLLLEAAWWDPVTIYRTGRALGLASDASYRFERGADIDGCAVALERAAALVAELAGGEVRRGVLDAYPTPRTARSVPLRPDRLDRLLGLEVEPDRAAAILEALAFQVTRRADAPWSVEVPSHRADISREEDLIEEVGRIIGYDHVPETMPQVHSRERGRLPGADLRRSVEHLLEAAGFYQAVNFSFVNRADDARFSTWPDEVVPLANPMSGSGEVMRSSLLPHLVRNVKHNIHFGTSRVRLYEVGRAFRRQPDAELPREILHLGMVATGPAQPPHWSSTQTDRSDVFDLTGAMEGALRRLRHPAPEARPCRAPAFEDGSGVSWWLDGREVARFGTLATAVAGALDLEHPVQVGEVVLEEFLAGTPEPLRVQPLPRFPSVVRDLSLVLAVERTYADVVATILSVDRETVVGVTPFDRYTGKGLPAGTVGLSVSILFQHPSRTLVSEEVDAIQEKIVAALDHKLGATLRSQEKR